MTSLSSACYSRSCDCTETQHRDCCISHSRNSKRFHRVMSTNWSLNNKTRWESQHNTSLDKCLVSSTQKPASSSWLNWALVPCQQHPLNSTVLEINLVYIISNNIKIDYLSRSCFIEVYLKTKGSHFDWENFLCSEFSRSGSSEHPISGIWRANRNSSCFLCQISCVSTDDFSEYMVPTF